VIVNLRACTALQGGALRLAPDARLMLLFAGIGILPGAW
jgi:hypothetical protein